MQQGFLFAPPPPESTRICRVPPAVETDLDSHTGADALVGVSSALAAVRHMVEKIGPTDATVLITGETGTGKELVARMIHTVSARSAEPWVAVNCGSIPEALLESQLFGHVRGAFTGADRDRRGLMVAAGRGTLLLDEVGEMPPALQPKILRALETREVLPVGSVVPVPIAARVIASTHRDLPEMIRQALFRSDLYYRLDVVRIHVPPLRERPGDVAILARHLLARACTKHRRPVPEVDPGVLEVLASYPWPGNVRELANVLERIAILHEGGRLRVDDLPMALTRPSGPIPDDLRQASRTFERDHILQVLRKFSGDKRRASRALGINLSSLYRKIRANGA